MTETTAVAKAPLRAGGNVAAIIPQDIEQVWRIAQMAAAGRMAPQSLVDKKSPEEAIAACAIAIMAGAELGLTPMTALRSYAVVNGRPTLWGDGLKAVVRQSGLCAYIKTGSDEEKGWCEAKRSDTDEVLRKEFTLAQAKKAGLLSKPGPWQSYPDMMMERRAASRCLNDLFADVLGGLVSHDEAEEYTVIDDAPRISSKTPPSPPPAPPAQEQPEKAQEPDKAPVEANDAPKGEDAVSAPSLFDLDRLRADLEAQTTEEGIEEVWDGHDLPSVLTHDEDALQEAFDIKNANLDRVQFGA